MALKASFYIQHPWSISHLRLTEKYVVASTVAGTVYVLDRQCRCVESSSDCEHLTTMEVGKMWDIDCCQDTLVTGNDDGILRVWDASTGALQRELAGHSGTVNRILLVDSTMAISSSKDATVIVWDLQTGVPRWKLESNGEIVEGLMEHENLLFTGARDGTVRAWNLDDGQCVRVLRGHTTAVWKMAFNQDASLLATAASGGSMRIWDAANDNCIAQCEGHSKIVTQFANLPENQLMTSAADGTIQTWDWNTGRNISTLAAHTNAVRGFFLTDQHVVSGGMDGCVWIRNRHEGTISRGMREEVGAVWHFVSNTDTIVLALRVGEGMHLVEIWDASAL